MGRLIPAGTGLGAYKRLTVDVDARRRGRRRGDDGRRRQRSGADAPTRDVTPTRSKRPSTSGPVVDVAGPRRTV